MFGFACFVGTVCALATPIVYIVKVINPSWPLSSVEMVAHTIAAMALSMLVLGVSWAISLMLAALACRGPRAVGFRRLGACRDWRWWAGTWWSDARIELVRFFGIEVAFRGYVR